MPKNMKLRRPWDRSIADCMWLARLTDKVRLHLAGELNADFEPFFGHKLATDGAFIAHFDFHLDTLIEVEQATPRDDLAVTEWFQRLPGASTEKIAAWNATAFDLGKPGHPMGRAFSWAKRKFYGGNEADPRVVSVFTGIAWDEGYLDQMPEQP